MGYQEIVSERVINKNKTFFNRNRKKYKLFGKLFANIISQSGDTINQIFECVRKLNSKFLKIKIKCSWNVRKKIKITLIKVKLCVYDFIVYLTKFFYCNMIVL